MRALPPIILVAMVILAGMVLLKPDAKLMYIGDDDDYFAVATAIAYGKFPRFDQEFHAGEKMPFASVGPGVLASPFVLSFSLVDRLTGKDIVTRRTMENRYWSWSLLGFQFASYFYLLAGALLLYEATKIWTSTFAASITTAANIFMSGGLLVYVFVRPVMSHCYEFFSICAALYLLSRTIKGDLIRFGSVLMGLTAAFVLLTRYNNAPLSVAMLAAYFYIQYRSKRVALTTELFKALTCFLLPIAFFRILPVVVNGYSSFDQGYGGALQRVSPMVNPLFYWNRTGEILFGMDMGLIYTAPALVLAFLCTRVFWNRAPKIFLFLASFIAINFYLAIAWRSFGSFYGYRYITFTAAPLLAIYLAAAADWASSKIGKPLVALATLALGVVPLISVAVFGMNSRFSFDRVINNYGVETYTQPEYHRNLLLDIWRDPHMFFNQLLEHFITSTNIHAIPPDHLLQRAILLLAPPVLAIVGYSAMVRRSNA